MIADIVAWKGNVCTVYSIEHFGGLVGVENEKICELVADKELQPIPLTEEILKANGFVKRGDVFYFNCGFLGSDWERSCVEIRVYDRAVIDIEINLRTHTNRVHLIADYFHELQHALRLCGLNELADNFKVELRDKKRWKLDL